MSSFTPREAMVLALIGALIGGASVAAGMYRKPAEMLEGIW